MYCIPLAEIINKLVPTTKLFKVMSTSVSEWALIRCEEGVIAYMYKYDYKVIGNKTGDTYTCTCTYIS